MASRETTTTVMAGRLQFWSVHLTCKRPCAPTSLVVPFKYNRAPPPEEGSSLGWDLWGQTCFTSLRMSGCGRPCRWWMDHPMAVESGSVSESR